MEREDSVFSSKATKDLVFFVILYLSVIRKGKCASSSNVMMIQQNNVFPRFPPTKKSKVENPQSQKLRVTGRILSV